MYIIYSMIQQQFTVIMLHSQDCTVLELGHSGRVPRLRDITLSLQLVQKTSLASGGITMSMNKTSDEKGAPSAKINDRREDDFGSDGFPDQKETI